VFVVLVDLEAPELSNQDDRQAEKKQYIIHKGGSAVKPVFGSGVACIASLVIF